MTDFVRDALRRAGIVIAVVACLIYSGLICANYVSLGKFSNDFSVYWRTANNAVEAAYLWQGRFPFPYAPTMLVWISPLSFIPKWPAYFLFVAASLTAYVLAVRPYLPKGAIALTMITPPFMRGMFTGQVCAALAALMIWACGTANRIGAGIAFGVIASIKPQLVLMAPLMLALNRDGRAFWSAAATFAAIAVLSLALFGPERWPEWFASMDHFRHAVADTNVIDVGVTPATFAERHGFSPLLFMLVGTVVGAVTVYLCRTKPPLEQAASITLGSLMAAPYALSYDLAPVMPFLALAVFRGQILAAIAMSTNYPSLPIPISTFELLRPNLRVSHRAFSLLNARLR